MEIPPIVKSSIRKTSLKRKGDLITANDEGQLETLPVGPDGTILTADSSHPTGFQWVPGNGSTANWGSISGIINNQSDLQSALAGKEPANPSIQTHIAATGNPHNTTKSDIGLDNVSNNRQVNAAASSTDGNLIAWSGSTGDTVVDTGKKISDFASQIHSHSPGQVGLGNVTNDAQIPKSLVSAKGDLLVGTGGETIARQAVGSDGQILQADSSQPTGVKWAPAGASSAIWGGISGSLSSQADLQNVLNGKAPKADKYVDDYPDFAAAIASLNSAGTKVILHVTSNQTVSSNLIANNNIMLQIHRGAVIMVNDGYTLTLRGSINAGPYQIFSCPGTGKVAFAASSYPGSGSDSPFHLRWWGAKGDNVTDDTNAINQAFAQAWNSNTGRANRIVGEPGDYYLINGTITISGPCAGQNYEKPEFDGQGCTFQQGAHSDMFNVGAWTVHLRNFRLLGNSDHTCQGNGLYLTSSRTLVTNVEFAWLGTALNAYYSIVNDIRDCYFIYNDKAVYAKPSAGVRQNMNRFVNCDFTTNGQLGGITFYGENGYGWDLEHCCFEVNGGADIYFKNCQAITLNNCGYESGGQTGSNYYSTIFDGCSGVSITGSSLAWLGKSGSNPTAILAGLYFLNGTKGVSLSGNNLYAAGLDTSHTVGFYNTDGSCSGITFYNNCIAADVCKYDKTTPPQAAFIGNSWTTNLGAWLTLGMDKVIKLGNSVGNAPFNFAVYNPTFKNAYNVVPTYVTFNSTGTPTTAAIDAATGVDDLRSLRITWNDPGAGNYAWISLANSFVAPAGMTAGYGVLSFWYKSDTSCTIKVALLGGGGMAYNVPIVGDNTWRLFSLRTASVNPQVNHGYSITNLDTTAGNFWIDCVQMLWFASADQADRAMGAVLPIPVQGANIVTNSAFSGNANSWSLGAGWSYNSNNVIHTPGSTGTLAPSTSLDLIAGKHYVVTWQIAGCTAGTVTASMAGVTGLPESSNAYHVLDVWAQNNNNLVLTPSSDFNGTVDLVQVWELDAASGGYLSTASGTVPVSRSQNGMTFQSTGAVTYNLPTGDLSGFLSNPLTYTFIKNAAGTVTIAAGTGNYVGTSSAGGSLSNATAGETAATITLRLVSSSSSVNKWVVISSVGTWAAS